MTFTYSQIELISNFNKLIDEESDLLQELLNRIDCSSIDDVHTKRMNNPRKLFSESWLKTLERYENTQSNRHKYTQLLSHISPGNHELTVQELEYYKLT